MKNVPEWREFEQLVARIEGAASPRGAIVKSPDLIRDLTTGELREVDASIKTKVGTSDILVTIECRCRQKPEDDTWIEQLATKRQKIGAARTIAVSRSGFTKSATKSAKHFGIELRTLSEVSATDIEGWFLAGGAVHVFRLVENVRCFVVLYEESRKPSKFGFWFPNVEASVFFHESQDSLFPIQDYIPILERTRPKMFLGVPLDGKKVELEFPIRWKFGELSIVAEPSNLSVHLTKLVATVSYQSAVCKTSSGIHHEYANPEGGVIQHTRFNAQLFGRAVTFEHQSDLNGRRSVSCKFSPKAPANPSKEM